MDLNDALARIDDAEQSALNNMGIITGPTPAQIVRGSADLFDRIARKNMGVSGGEFLTRWDSGEWDGLDWDAVPGLCAVAMAIPLARHE